MRGLIALVGLGACAQDVWNYRQMSCGDGERLDLRDGQSRPLVVRSTCRDDIDASECELKLTGLRGGYASQDGTHLQAHEIEEIEVEAYSFRQAELLWGAAPIGADVALQAGDYALRVTGGPTGLDPDGAEPGFASVNFNPEPTSEGPPLLEVFCGDCVVDAVAPPDVRGILTDGARVRVCVDDDTAVASPTVIGDAALELVFPRGFTAVTLGSDDQAHTGSVRIVSATLPEGGVNASPDVDWTHDTDVPESCDAAFPDEAFPCAASE